MRGSIFSLAAVGLLLVACGDDIPLNDDSDPDTDTDTSSTSSTTLPGTSTSTTTTTSTTTDPGTTTSDTSSSTDPTGSSSSSSSGEESSSSSSSGSSSSSTGMALAPEIDVSFDVTTVASGGSYEVLETVDVDATGSTITITIDNTGTADLDLSAFSITGASPSHFDLDISATAATVGAGESTTMDLTFAPTSGGLKSADIRITSNDADETTYLVTADASTTPNTWREITPTSSPSARFNSAMVAMDDGTLLLFGGRAIDGGQIGDTWTFDPEAGDWTLVPTMGGPTPRFGHGLAAVGAGQAVLFAGAAIVTGFGGAPPPSDETWVYDAGTTQWTFQAPVSSPPRRFQHGMVGATGLAAVFGGQDNSNFPTISYGDFWAYNVATNVWAPLKVANGPGPRHAPGMAFDGVNTVTLYGGLLPGFKGPGTLFDDTWNLSISGVTIAESMSLTNPGTRFNAELTYLSTGVAIAFAGRQTECCADPIGGTFAYDPVGDTWTDLAPAIEPVARHAYVSAAPGENKLIIFGGNDASGASGAIGDTWEYVGPRP